MWKITRQTALWVFFDLCRQQTEEAPEVAPAPFGKDSHKSHPQSHHCLQYGAQEVHLGNTVRHCAVASSPLQSHD